MTENILDGLNPLSRWVVKQCSFELQKEIIVEDFNRIVARDGCFSSYGMDELRKKYALSEDVIWEFLVKLDLVSN